MKKNRSFLIISPLLFLLFTGFDQDQKLNYIPVGHFSEFSRGEWFPKSWKRHAFQDVPKDTRYSLVEDERGITVLKAESFQGALALTHQLNVDPKKFPILTWRWKIHDVIQWSNLRTKDGDDHPVRLYVFF